MNFRRSAVIFWGLFIFLGLIIVPLASAACPLASTSPTVVICTPASGTSVTSPVAISASANDTAHPVVAMKAYLDYSATAVATGSSNQLSASVPAGTGSHHLTVRAWDSSGASFSKSVDFSVGSAPPPPPPPSGCSLASTSPTVKICNPGSGSTITSPFTLSASANDTAHSVVKMKAYLDYNSTPVAVSSTNQLSAPLTAGAGSHHLTVRAWDSSGAAFSTSENFSISSSGGGPGVTVSGIYTFAGNAARTGLNASEGTLTPANVNSTQFGKLFSLPVDGQVYAQPLYVAGVAIAAGTHNVLYVATEHNSVYAFDADTAGPALWQVSLGTPASSCLVQSTVLHIVPEVGITSTPVIDPASNTIYVVAETAPNDVPTFSLHALDITSGAERPGSPVVIQGSVTGASPYQSDGAGNVVFSPGANSLQQLQRTALLLANANVYVAFASHADTEPYHGWVFAYNASTLAQNAVFNTTRNGAGSEQGKGGIWMSGGGPAADAAGNIYVGVGNGTFDADSSGVDFGDSLLKLSGLLAVSDWFTPFNEATMQSQDKDLGSSGLLVVPDQSSGPAHLLISGGKAGGLYVVNRDNMGRFNASGDTQIVQTLPSAIGPLFATPGYFYGKVYVGPVNQAPKAFTLSGGKLSLSATAPGTIGFPGASPTISANGVSNGIVWMLDSSAFGGKPSSCSAQPAAGSAVLHAYDAANLASELYNSNQAASRDDPGGAVRFTVPTVANGKVYVGTTNQVTVFGLLP